MKKMFYLIIFSSYFLFQSHAFASYGLVCQGKAVDDQSTLDHLIVKFDYKLNPSNQKFESSPEFILYGLKDPMSGPSEAVRFKNNCGEKFVGVGAGPNEWMEIPESLYCDSGDHILNHFSSDYFQMNEGDVMTAVGTFFNDTVFELSCVFSHNIEKKIKELGPYLDQHEWFYFGGFEGVMLHDDSSTNVMMKKMFEACKDHSKALGYLVKFSKLINPLNAVMIDISADGYKGIGKKFSQRNQFGKNLTYKIVEQEFQNAQGTLMSHQIYAVVAPFNIAVYAELDSHHPKCSVHNFVGR